MKPIVTDTYDFPTLIRRGYVYVDKTALLHRLISGVDGLMFFMSRPRRFGKSLMISTLEQIFKGNRRLFKGLAIDKMDYDWQAHPVLRLDMSLVKARSVEGYGKALCAIVHSMARDFGCVLASEGNPSLALSQFFDALAARGEKVVVLIDEYDAPISGLLGKHELLEEIRTLLHDFYTVLKAHAGDIHFLMMTGVSKFTKLSVFSGLNNLTDLTMSGIYASLLGYTKEELASAFGDHIVAFARKLGKTRKETIAALLDWYDSYRFSPNSDIRVCNPVSVGRSLQEQRFDGFWDATGNPTIIIERLRRARKMPLDLEGLVVRSEQLDVCDARSLPMVPLLYQGGYLTIDHAEPSGLLSLRVPNREVSQALDRGYVASVMKASSDEFTNSALRLMDELGNASDAASVLQRVLTSVFAMVPHEWKLKSEAEAKRYFLLFMRMAGARINAEVESSNGRADSILETTKSIYILEFKYGKTAKAALKQCRDRNYAASFAADKRKVFYVGLNYVVERATIEVVCEPVNEPVNSVAEPVNEPVFRKVLDTIVRRPGQRRPALLQEIDVSEATMKRVLSKLIHLNRIEFRGAPKTGGYYPVNIPADMI